MINRLSYKPLFIFPTLLIIALFLNNCQSVTEPTYTVNAVDTAAVTLSGQVINKDTGALLDSVYITTRSDLEEKVGMTDSQGNYQIDIKVGSSKNVVVTAIKNGFTPESTTVNATSTMNSVRILKLEPLSITPGSSGAPASIYLFSQTATSIGVKESGSPETAILTFEIQDSTGRPIDSSKAVDVNFTFGAHPDGGEFLTPTVRSNEFGQVSTTLTSGAKAGVVQVIAEINYNGKIIRSRPVAISIYGGLPNVEHFSIGIDKSDSTYTFGSKNKVTAYVGDKYGNPVQPGTSVYFTTTSGIIGGSGYTDVNGECTVTITWVEPEPTSNSAIITASTGDENNSTIYKSLVVSFSGN